MEAGFFTRTGGRPVELGGGVKCCGQPVGASGIRMAYELYEHLQQRVDNPKGKLENVHVGVWHTFGGPPQISAVMIVGNEK